MPVLSVFYGIVVKMYFRQSEHNPPHVHVTYGEHVGVMEIKTGKLLDGNLPPKALVLVAEWLMLNQDELMDIWKTQNFRKVEPLK